MTIFGDNKDQKAAFFLPAGVSMSHRHVMLLLYCENHKTANCSTTAEARVKMGSDL
jgi:hypothetical protein